ncbi:hypothetical protein, partial [Streptomyces albidoflavus]|uniref:hypothetical protein n=1 Tax=Streptomyces albidoflavus TaxID=1886 RepID=UPI0033A6495F
RQFEEQPEVRYGLTTMCVGFGMGATVIWENPPPSTRSHREPTPPALRRRAVPDRRSLPGRVRERR